MSASSPPEITLELTGGSLTIRTVEAIYHIHVALAASGGQAALPAGSAPAALPPTAPQAPPPAAKSDDNWDDLDIPDESAPLPDFGEPPEGPPPAEGAADAPEDEEYYRQLSHDMFREVGRLARRLSMSIRDVKVERIEGVDLESVGVQLEDAKDQLENVVKMTEQATLKIMDLGEDIQNAIDTARGIMEQISTSGEGEDAPDEGGGEAEEARQRLEEAVSALSRYLADLGQEPLAPILEQAQALQAELAQAPAPAPEPAPVEEAAPAEPPAPSGPYYNFPMDLVFQTTYEMCTNETVKKHVKAMWDAAAKSFDAAAIEAGMNKLVTEEPDEDNFLNLDLKGVLKTLFQATSEDRYKQVLKKMATTVDQIFLEPSLPLEAIPAEAPAAPAPAPKPAPKPAPAAPAGPAPETLAKLEALVNSLQEAADKLTPPETPDDLPGLLQSALEAGQAAAGNVLHPELVEKLDKVMGVIFSSVNSIIEALSFQDLSGQTIYRIVKLLTEFQVQLLAMVVSFGSKLKTKEEKQEVDVEESERMAQQEVEQALSSLGVTEGEEEGEAAEASQLDQDSVNSLLDSLGF